ncbi:MAG: hypothetical protein KKF54_04630 [Candidatus Omnitrophica bacterium]|nr:hypothetical protein [Candidatus Omnitrophota bacterium]
MKIKITKGKKPFGSWKAISERAVNEDEVVMVEFPNCSFIWLPTYKQLEEIQKALKEVEELNKNENTTEA